MPARPLPTRLSAVVLLAILLAAAGPVALRDGPPAAASAPADAPPDAEAAEDAARVDALAARDKDRIRQLGRLAEDAPPGQPFRRVDATTGYASLILPERDAPYTVPELAVRFPESVAEVAGGVYLVSDDVVVGAGAELRVTADRVRQLRLLSRPDRFVTVTSWRGTIRVEGDAWRRVGILSWDPGLAGPDPTLSDGRAWLHTRRGSMTISWADLEYLGFATGSLSGVAWEGRAEDPSRGDVTGSTFRHNYFGAYTFEAVGMTWRLNTFAYNVVYGFDPHDRSNYFLVEYNRAYRNGTHGIIFSRACSYNVIRFNHSFDNGMHGIVLDDGPNQNPDGTPRERQGIPSDDNTVVGNVVTGNEVGIVLDGGTRNRIAGNLVAGNRYGLRMKDAVNGNVVEANRFADNAEFGIYLYNRSNDNVIAGNTVVGGESGIVVKDSSGSLIDGNTLSGMDRNGLSLSGDVQGTTIVDNRVSDVGRGISLSQVTDGTDVTQRGNRVEGEGRSTDPASFWQPLTRWVIWGSALVAPVLLGPWYGRLLAAVRRSLRPARPSGASSSG